jgi:hypothetical protein
MRRLLPALATAALALPAAASAKELTALSVCGTNGCHTTRDRSALRTAMNVQPQAAPDQGGVFYRVRSRMEHGMPAMRSQWIPSLRLLRNDDGELVEFSLPYPQTERLLRRLSIGLEPFPAGRLGPIGGTPQTAKVDEIVAAPSSGGDDGPDWAWSLLAIPPLGIALWRRRLA